MKSILEALFMELNIMESLPIRICKTKPDIESFIKALTPEQQKQYETISDAYMEQWALDNQDCFVIGFKLAVRMVLESMLESDKK